MNSCCREIELCSNSYHWFGISGPMLAFLWVLKIIVRVDSILFQLIKVWSLIAENLLFVENYGSTHAFYLHGGLVCLEKKIQILLLLAYTKQNRNKFPSLAK